jgi:Omp85 superfamily domain
LFAVDVVHLGPIHGESVQDVIDTDIKGVGAEAFHLTGNFVPILHDDDIGLFASVKRTHHQEVAASRSHCCGSFAHRQPSDRHRCCTSVGYIFPFQEKDKLSPPSVIGAGGLITDNGSRGFGIGGDLFMKEDNYELKTVYVHGNIDYDLFGVGFANGNAGLKLPLKQAGQLFFIECLKNIGWKFFVRPRFVNGNSFITVNSTSGDFALIPPDTGLTTNLRAVGIGVVCDSRINRFYSTKGMFLQFTGDFFSQGLGSKHSFQSHKVTFNKYQGFCSRHVLAYNLFLCGTGGEPPFNGNCIYGANNELRGYQAGRYLDRYMFATQLEYRAGGQRACLRAQFRPGFAPRRNKFSRRIPWNGNVAWGIIFRAKALVGRHDQLCGILSAHPIDRSRSARSHTVRVTSRLLRHHRDRAIRTPHDRCA